MQPIVPFLLALTLQGQAAAAQRAASPPLPPNKVITELTVGVDEVQPTLGGRRLYYTFDSSQLWVYDVASKRSSKLFTGDMPEGLSVSAQGNRVAFVRLVEGTSESYAIWTIPLDPKTGLATGPARRASVSYGTDPSLSPDGKWIAFPARKDKGPTQLVIIPSGGGAERLVLDGLDRIQGINWSRDQKWLYFNGRGVGSSEYTLQRIPVAGGKPVALAEHLRWFGGLSPDGAFLAVSLTKGPPQFLDMNGKHVAEDPVGVDAWLTTSEVLTFPGHRRNALQAVSIADGKMREVLPAAYDVSQPAWAPDGKHFAVLSWNPDTLRLLIVDADGTNPRAIPVPQNAGAYGMAWSPDGRWIAMNDRRLSGIVAVDVVNGRAQRLHTAANHGIGHFRWLPDSKHVRYVLRDVPPDSGGSSAYRDVGLDGSDVLVRELPLAGRMFISDTTVLESINSTTYIASLTSGRVIRLWPRRGSPSASAGGDLVVMSPPIGPGQASVSTAEVMTSTGSHVSIVTFPSAVRIGLWNTFAFTPDNKNLVTFGWNQSAKGCCVIYLAPIDGGPVRKLAEFPYGNGRIPGFALSPDGKTLLTMSGTTSRTVFESTNIAGLLHSAPKN